MMVQHPDFLTESKIMAEAATRRDSARHPGQRTIRPNLHHFVSYMQGIDPRIFKIKRENNIIAHKHSQEAYHMTNLATCSYSCLNPMHDTSKCHVKAILGSLNVHSCTMMLVTWQKERTFVLCWCLHPPFRQTVD
jgi:hypothetical protein